MNSCFNFLFDPCMYNDYGVAQKCAVREQKLNLEISAAKRERDFYLKKVDQSRGLTSMQERVNKVSVQYVLLLSYVIPSLNSSKNITQVFLYINIDAIHYIYIFVLRSGNNCAETKN